MVIRSFPVQSVPAWAVRPSGGGDIGVWQLEGSTDGESWRVVNANVMPVDAVRPASGRFEDDEGFYRLGWVPHGGGTIVWDAMGEVGELAVRRARMVGGRRVA